MLFALADFPSFVGLLLGFLAALLVRAWALNAARAALRLPTGPPVSLPAAADPFGAVAAAVAGTGWGRHVDLDQPGSRGRRVAVVAAGLLAPLLLGVALLAVYGAVFGAAVRADGFLLQGFATDAGAPGDVLLGCAVGLVSVTLLNLLPLPPLDGFSLLWVAMRRPGRHAAAIRHTLVDNNVGPLILMVLSFFPVGGPYLLLPVELLTGVLVLVVS